MRTYRYLLCCVAVVALSVGPAFCDEPSGWDTDLDSAKQRAAASGRMVLIHFWAPWCAPCMQLDRNVLSKPTVIADLQRHLVPVKLNVDQHEATAQQYGVKSLPTDVVITPQGDLVKLVSSPRSASSYVTELSEVAVGAKAAIAARYAPSAKDADADALADAAPYAAAGNAPPHDDAPRMSAEMPAGGRSSSGGDNGVRYDLADRPSAAPYNQRVAANWSGGAALATDSPDDPSAAYDGPIAEGDAGEPASLADRYDRPAADAPRAATPVLGTASSVAAQPSPDVAARPDYDALPPPAGVRPAPVSRPTAGQLPPGNPPLGLDGFCPVHLAESKKWLRGDTRYGAIHRGRTYLFGSEGCQQKFLADPDRFSPVLQGNDVIVAVESGQAVPGRREFGVFYGDRVYLFATEANLRRFENEHQRLADAAAKLVK